MTDREDRKRQREKEGTQLCTHTTGKTKPQNKQLHKRVPHIPHCSVPRRQTLFHSFVAFPAKGQFSFNVLAKKDVPKQQLVTSEAPPTNYKREWPLDLVIDTETFIA